MGRAASDDPRGERSHPIRTPDQRIRVFISSTLGELADERAAARSAVEQLRLTPVMFEAGARPHPPRALYRSYLGQSDVFVGIYWQRYGWVAPDMDISGLEDELRLSRGMPRLIYVKRPAPEMEERLTAMLHGLEGDDGPSYKPFADASQLRELLADDLALLLAERFDAVDGGEPGTGPTRSNLPAATSTFVGREAELAQLCDLLDGGSARLITLVGPGGTGKTRLAIEAARSGQDRFVDGVFLVDLTEERDPDDAFGAIARALAIQAPSPASPLDRVAHELADHQALLVLDNVEQVTTVGPGLVRLLERCPRLQLLVTSREVLRVRAEHVFPVPVLSVPVADGTRPSVDDVLASEAGRLFFDRASAAGSRVEPTAREAADVAVICQRLDGLPLAIELAAARAKLLSISELRARLDKRLDLLTGGSRDQPSRQWTLRDAIEWSEDLLIDPERMVFRLFPVFSDGRLGDVDEVVRGLPECGGMDVEGALSSLLDKSLLRVTEGSDRRPRLSMLQTIREYATERLGATEDLAARMRRAHAEHYTAVALDLHRQLTYVDRDAVLALLGDELGNLRTAWQHWLEQRDLVRLDELLAPLWGYHEARGDYPAAMVLGESLLGTLPQLPESRERRHDELALRAILARTQMVVHGFNHDAERAMVEALERFESSPDARQRFPALRSLASLQLWRSDFDRGAATARELRAIADHEQEPALLLEAHLVSCISESWRYDLTAAIAHADEAAAQFAATTSGFVEFRVGPNPGVVANAMAGLLRWTAGLPDAAQVSMQQALDLADDLGHPYSRGFALHHATLLDLWRSDLASVASRAEESRRLAETHDYALWLALAVVFQGAALVGDGEPDEGLRVLEEGFARCEQVQTPPIFWPALLTIRATTHGWAGEVERALGFVDEAWASLSADHPDTADLAIAQGDLLLAAPPADDGAARALFERAAELSAARGARMVELRALTRLVPVAGSAPAAAEDAHRRLRAAYDAITEGRSTPPLRVAAVAIDLDRA